MKKIKNVVLSLVFIVMLFNRSQSELHHIELIQPGFPVVSTETKSVTGNFTNTKENPSVLLTYGEILTLRYFPPSSPTAAYGCLAEHERLVPAHAQEPVPERPSFSGNGP